jgi:hypothetical protein
VSGSDGAGLLVAAIVVGVVGYFAVRGVGLIWGWLT